MVMRAHDLLSKMQLQDLPMTCPCLGVGVQAEAMPAILAKNELEENGHLQWNPQGRVTHAHMHSLPITLSCE